RLDQHVLVGGPGAAAYEPVTAAFAERSQERPVAVDLRDPFPHLIEARISGDVHPAAIDAEQREACGILCGHDTDGVEPAIRGAEQHARAAAQPARVGREDAVHHHDATAARCRFAYEY